MTSLFISLSASALLFATRLCAETEAEKELVNAESRYFRERSIAQSDYRKDLADILAQADRIEVYLLDFEMSETPSNFLYWENQLNEGEFPILPYGKKAKVLQQATLTEKQRKRFLPELQAVVGVPGEIDGGAFCHFPIHGVRIFSGDATLFQSSFCWKCTNFALPYPDGPAWVAIRGDRLFQAFHEVLPIPDEELERFEARISSKPHNEENREEGPSSPNPETLDQRNGRE